MFRRRGAYGRFKELLEAKDLLDEWYRFEHETEQAVLRSCVRRKESPFRTRIGQAGRIGTKAQRSRGIASASLHGPLFPVQRGVRGEWADTIRGSSTKARRS